MRKGLKVLAIVLGAVLLVSVLAGGAVLAADPPPTTTPTSAYDIFISKLAARLNVTVEQLKAAFTEARTDTVNQLATEGKITPEQKDWMLNAQQNNGNWGGYGPGMMGGGWGMGGFGGMMGGFGGGPAGCPHYGAGTQIPTR